MVLRPVDLFHEHLVCLHAFGSSTCNDVFPESERKWTDFLSLFCLEFNHFEMVFEFLFVNLIFFMWIMLLILAAISPFDGIFFYTEFDILLKFNKFLWMNLIFSIRISFFLLIFNILLRFPQIRWELCPFALNFVRLSKNLAHLRYILLI